MDAPTWTTEHPLVRFVLQKPRSFEFFQLLHLIERLLPQCAQIGRAGPAGDEPVRLRPSLSMSFPACDLDTMAWTEDALNGSGKLQVTTTFLGLYGTDSPLPTHFTESLMAEHEEDERVRGFLDLFHHRVLSLLFRVWTKYRYYVTFRSDGSDPISQMVRGLLGIGTTGLSDALKVPPVRLFRYVGLLSQRPRSAAGLTGLLSDFFEGIDFDIEQCVGRWLPIQMNDCNRLGGRKCSLGQDFLLGDRIFDCSGKFRVKVGPVGFDDFQRFLPPGDAAADLAGLAQIYCADALQFDAEVTLRGAEVPDTPLGGQGLLGRLAWTSWLKSKPCDDQSVVFSVPAEIAAPRRENVPKDVGGG